MMFFKIPVLALCLLATGVNAQVTSGHVNLLPEKPVPGKFIQVNYLCPSNIFDQNMPVNAVVYQYAAYRWHIDTLAMTAKGPLWNARIKLLDKTAFLAFKFYQAALSSPTVVEHNEGEGYRRLITDRKGRKLTGGALAQALFHLSGDKGGAPGYFEQVPSNFPIDSLRLLLEEELNRRGNSPGNFAHAYISLQRTITGSQFKSVAPQLLEKLLEDKGISGSDSAEIYRIYRFELKDNDKADQLKAGIIAQHPRGEFARLEAYHQASLHNASNEDIIAGTKKFLDEFPISEQRKYSPEQDYIYYGVFRSLATAYFQTGNFQPLLDLRKFWDFKTENEICRWNIDRAFLLKTARPESFQALADSLVKDLLTKLTDGSYRSDFDIMAEGYANARKQMDERLRMQINIHYTLGKNTSALAYFKLLSPERLYADADMNQLHLDLLDRLGQKQEVGQLLEQSIKANAVTPKLFARLKENYVQKHGGEKGYDMYLASLKSSSEINELKSYVRKHLMNQEVMPFALEDLNGNIVQSGDWEGKIVVIDFWATWCRPCIMAFPGMQMMVDKYAKDPNVDFYFIGTMQSGDYKQRVKDFMDREGWRFKVLHDGVNKKTGQQDAVFSTLVPIFNSSGIPRKIILKNGLIRYSTEGYSGSPSQLVDELSYAISFLKSEK